MSKFDEFQALILEWQKAKQATAMAQLNLDLKMSGCLSGLGNPPTYEEQMEVDRLRADEIEKRGALDVIIYQYMETGTAEESNLYRDIFSLIHSIQNAVK